MRISSGTSTHIYDSLEADIVEEIGRQTPFKHCRCPEQCNLHEKEWHMVKGFKIWRKRERKVESKLYTSDNCLSRYDQFFVVIGGGPSDFPSSKGLQCNFAPLNFLALKCLTSLLHHPTPINDDHSLSYILFILPFILSISRRFLNELTRFIIVNLHCRHSPVMDDMGNLLVCLTIIIFHEL